MRKLTEEEKKNSKTFTSMERLAEHLNIPKSLLGAAKRKGAPGFNDNGRIYWDALEPWFTEHREELESEVEDTLTKWKTRKTRADAKIAELELEEMQEKYLIKDEVKSFLKQISSAQMAMLKSKLCDELPPKILGLSLTDTEVMMHNTLHEVCAVFKKKIEDWK